MTSRQPSTVLVIAESDQPEVVEGNHYFPEGSIREEFSSPPRMKSLSPREGAPRYYIVTVEDARAANAAWSTADDCRWPAD